MSILLTVYSIIGVLSSLLSLVVGTFFIIVGMHFDPEEKVLLFLGLCVVSLIVGILWLPLLLAWIGISIVRKFIDPINRIGM